MEPLFEPAGCSETDDGVLEVKTLRAAAGTYPSSPSGSATTSTFFASLGVGIDWRLCREVSNRFFFTFERSPRRKCLKVWQKPAKSQKIPKKRLHLASPGSPRHPPKGLRKCGLRACPLMLRTLTRNGPENREIWHTFGRWNRFRVEF